MIKENVKAFLEEIPPHVELVAAAKGRTPEEMLQAVEAGVKIIGHNYVQEAQKAFQLIGNKIKWHFIGHLQKNKVKKAIELFDMIETVDSFSLAKEINKRCRPKNKIMPVLIEVNSGREPQKFGVLPEETETLIKEIGRLENIRLLGLMTMGPEVGDPEDARPYFQVTRELFEKIKKLDLPHIEMKYLSMGMTNSYRVAIEEGANMIRIGTKIFGPRNYD